MSDYRTIDGTGNNEDNFEWGSTDEWFLRKSEKTWYDDGISEPGGVGRPSARVISNALFSQDGDIANSTGASDFLWVWGQFIDHDIDLTMGGGEMFNIEVPLGDPYFDPFFTGTQQIPLDRSGFAEGTGTEEEPAQQVNQITAFIDASNVYGSDQARADFLRDPVEPGKMKTTDGDLLPYNTEGFDNAPGPMPNFYLAGDVRANENVVLTSMHTVFVREHNRLVDELAEQHPDWDSDKLYQEAKLLVGAELQSITYNEYLPVLLGADAIAEYEGYDADIDPSIANIFATAAFRFGHSQLSSLIYRIDEDGAEIEQGNLQLRDAFFHPDLMLNAEGVDAALRGVAEHVSQEIDLQMVDDVRNFLFGPPGAGGFDLAALNIQRGRDHGLPDYNSAREAYGLDPVTKFSHITKDKDIQDTLEELFGSVDNIDVFVGGLAEDHHEGSMLGELFHTILVDQFTRLRDGDSFFYKTHLTEEQIEFVESMQLSDIIEINTGIEHIQDNVFFAYDRIGGTDGDDTMHGTGDRDLMMGKNGDDTLFGHKGDDQLFGGGGQDHLYGDGGSDILEGGADSDWLYGGREADLLIGGDGADHLYGGAGADIFQFVIVENEDGELMLEDGSEDRIGDFNVRQGDSLQFDVSVDVELEDLNDAADFHSHGQHLQIEFSGGGALAIYGAPGVSEFGDAALPVELV
ncbi:MAG: peroxidase family protein [Pseudomonadota bacterium]